LSVGTEEMQVLALGYKEEVRENAIACLIFP